MRQKNGPEGHHVVEHSANEFEKLLESDTGWRLESGHDKKKDSIKSVPAIDKMIAILTLINASGTSLPLASISMQTGITKSHCYSILKTLVKHDWVHFDNVGKTYRLNAGIIRDLSSIVYRTSPIATIRPIIEELPLRIGVSCTLTEPLDRRGFIIVIKASAPNYLEIGYPVGHFFPRDASAQIRALLAWSEESEIQAWMHGWQPIRYATSTPVPLEQVRRELETTRMQGYSRSIGEFTEGLTALALPIFNAAGKVIFILNCVGLSHMIAPIERRIAEQLIATVGDIHRLIGSLVPADFPTQLPGGSGT